MVVLRSVNPAPGLFRGARRASLVVTTALVASACGSPVVFAVTDSIRFRDRTQLSLTRPDGTAPRPASRPTSGPASGPVLGAGRAETRDGASTDYVVQVTSSADGAPELHWETRLPLVDGDYRQVLKPGEPIVIEEAVDRKADHPWTTVDDQFHLDACTFLQAVSSGGGTVGHMIAPRHHFGFRIGLALPCGAAVRDAVRFGLETPWTNVAEIRRTVRYRHAGPFLARLAAGGGVLVTGAAMAVAGGSHFSGGAKAGWYVGSGAVMAIGTVLLFWALTARQYWDETTLLPLR